MVGLEWKHYIYLKRDRSNIKDVWCQLWGLFRICLRHLSVGTVSKIVAVLLGPQSFPLCCLQHPEKWPPMTSLEMKMMPLRSGKEGLSGPFQVCCFPAKLPCVYWTQEGCGEGWSSRYHLEGDRVGPRDAFYEVRQAWGILITSLLCCLTPLCLP